MAASLQAYARANAVFAPGAKSHSIKLLMQLLQASSGKLERAASAKPQSILSKTAKVVLASLSASSVALTTVIRAQSSLGGNEDALLSSGIGLQTRSWPVWTILCMLLLFIVIVTALMSPNTAKPQNLKLSSSDFTAKNVSTAKRSFDLSLLSET